MPVQLDSQRKKDTTDSLIGSIYSTIDSPEAWREVVPKVARHVGAESALLFTLTEANLPRGFAIRHNIPEESLRDYGAHFHAHDVWKEAADRNGLLKAGCQFRGEQILPTNTMRRSEIYADLWRPLNITHLLCASLTDEQHIDLGPSTVFSLFRSSQKGAFSDAAAARCDALMPHIRRALLATWRLKGVQKLLSAYQVGLHATGDVILLLGANMSVHHASAEPPEIFGPGSTIQITHGKLTAATSENRARIALTVRDAASGRPSGAFRMDGQEGSVIEIVVLPHSDGCLVARIRRIQRSANEAVARTAQRFRLTHAEQRVLTLLAGGSSIAVISVELAIRPMTVRTHLANLYEKTGTHSQRELVALVWRNA